MNILGLMYTPMCPQPLYISPKPCKLLLQWRANSYILIGRFLGQFKLRSHFTHQSFYNAYISYINCMPTFTIYISHTYIACHLSIYISHTYIACFNIYISYIYCMSFYIYLYTYLIHIQYASTSYLIHTLNMQDECINKE